MIRLVLVGAFIFWASGVTHSQITLQECVDLARDNYPLIEKYDLLNRTRTIDLSDVNKSWLPQINVYGQGTAQNVVPSFPSALSDVLDKLGSDMEGLGKLQYRVGVDVNQTIWDGGVSKSRREIVRAEDAERRAALEVQLYAVRERVENLYFGILLMDEQIKQTQIMRELLKSNLDQLESMKANGTAMQSDVDMVEAQYIITAQQLVQYRTDCESFRRMLGVFTGKDMQGLHLEKPAPKMPADMSVNRPELGHFDARIAADEARRSSISSSLMPKVGMFAQAYYGYPGIDYFKSMTERTPSFNITAGIKVSWEIGSFYTKSNRENKLRLSTDGVNVERDVFLFNTSLQTQSQTDRIRELEEIMKEDSRIVELRANVRKAAESQLRNGVIDATALLTKITDENRARLTESYHEIQLIQSIYQLKYTLDR